MAAPFTAAAPPVLAPLHLRERALLVGALLLAAGASWAYLAWMAADMAGGDGAALARCAAMPGMTSSRGAYLGWLFVMWAVMAVAMMLPTALPLLFLFTRFWRARHPGTGLAGPTAALALGYLVAWVAFGAGAAALQLLLERADLATPGAGQLRSAQVGGATLVAAGLFQLTPLKEACLSRCRSPLMFLMTRWREGRLGPLRMGLDHGLFCLGCCWALMLVMFAVGVMNLLWMAALTVLMAAEKVVPRGVTLARAAGLALLAAGAWLAAG